MVLAGGTINSSKTHQGAGVCVRIARRSLPPLVKGDVREQEAMQKLQASGTAEFMRSSKLPENPRKSGANICAMVRP